MTQLKASLLLLLAALFWGGGNVAQKTVLADLGPLTTVGLRCLIGALVILPFVLRGRHIAAAFAPDARRLTVIAVTLFALAIGSQQAAYAGTSVTNASFLITTTIVITPFIAWLMLRERPAAILWPAAGLTLIGTFLLGGGAFSSLSWGDLCCLVSAVLYSAWIVVLGRLVTATGCPGLAMLAHFLLAGALCLALGLASEPAGLGTIENAIPELLFLGVFSTGLAYAFQALAQQHVSASMAALILSAESVFGALGGTVLLGEQLTLSGGIGAGLILAAILLVQIGPLPAIRRALGTGAEPATTRFRTTLAVAGPISAMARSAMTASPVVRMKTLSSAVPMTRTAPALPTAARRRSSDR